MKCLLFRPAILAIVFALSASYAGEKKPVNQQPKERLGEKVMQIHYLEIVTKNVDAVCAAYAAVNGVQFDEPNAEFGNARTAALPDGGLVGVRAPMRNNFAIAYTCTWVSARGAVEWEVMLRPENTTESVQTDNGDYKTTIIGDCPYLILFDLFDPI